MHVVRIVERDFAVAYTAFESSKKDSYGYPEIGSKVDNQGKEVLYYVDFKDTEIIIGAGSYVKNGKKYKRENYQTYSLNDLVSLLKSKNTHVFAFSKEQERFKNGINSIITDIETYYPNFTNQNYGYIDYDSNVNYSKKVTHSSYSNGDNVFFTGTLKYLSEVKEFGFFAGERIYFYVLEFPNSITVENISSKQIQLNILTDSNFEKFKRYINKKVTVSGSLRIPDTMNWQRNIVLDNPSLQ